MHPTEAHRGDLGMVTNQDVVLALSHSGSSNELVELLPHIKRIGAQLIALVGRLDSPLGNHADLTLHIGELPEACPLASPPRPVPQSCLPLEMPYRLPFLIGEVLNAKIMRVFILRAPWGAN